MLLLYSRQRRFNHKPFTELNSFTIVYQEQDILSEVVNLKGWYQYDK